MVSDTLQSFIRGADSAQTFEIGGGRLTFLVNSEDTHGAYAAILYEVPPQFPGPVAHVHHKMTEVFFVTEGELTIHLREGKNVLGAGEVAFVAPGTAHKFSNPTDKSTKVLVMMNPGGMENYFRELVAYIKTIDEWPPKDPTELNNIMAKYDQEVVFDMPFA